MLKKFLLPLASRAVGIKHDAPPVIKHYRIPRVPSQFAGK